MTISNASASPVVLVVDDEEPIRMAARRILEASGYAVLEAENGARAIELLQGGTAVDLVIADFEMPGMSGEEMVRQLRTERRDLKVLYVSGYIDRLLNERPTLWEGEAFLDKPFTFEGLTEAVSLLLFGTLKPPADRMR
jgi:two-component system cell cycle sensor histidine kinase/response regulator CckA